MNLQPKVLQPHENDNFRNADCRKTIKGCKKVTPFGMVWKWFPKSCCKYVTWDDSFSRNAKFS